MSVAHHPNALKYAIVGAGAIARSYAQAFTATPDAKLVAVTDVRADAARSLADAYGAVALEDHRALKKHGIEAVIVCSPPNTHESVCTELLGEGIPVLCEKPLSVDSASARRMLEAAKKSGRIFSMASKFRFVDDVMKAHNIVESGVLGDIILFENAFTARVDMSKRWNSNPEISGGGVLIDNGTHSVDIMRYFLGPIAEVLVVEGRRMQAVAVEDTARMFIRSERGVVGTIDLSWTINKELSSFIDVFGTEGVVRVGWKESKFRQSSSPDWTIFGKGYDKDGAFRRQIENFTGAVRGTQQVRVTPEDALASVQVIEAAYASMRSGTWTKINPAE